MTDKPGGLENGPQPAPEPEGGEGQAAGGPQPGAGADRPAGAAAPGQGADPSSTAGTGVGAGPVGAYEPPGARAVSPSEWQASGGAALAADALMGPAALGEQIGLVGVADVQRSSASVPGAGASAGGTSNGAYAGAGAAPGEPEMRVGGRLDSRQGRTFWVRSRLLVLIAAIWGILFWYSLSDPLVSVHNGLVMTWDSKWWLEILFALELLRQVHYLISEHWQRWNTFWSEVVFGGMSRRSLHVSDWARYRIKRIIAVLVVIGLVAAIAGAAQQENPVQGLFSLPSHLVSVFGYIAYLLFVVGAIVLQFVALFFFLSRGGIEVYFPDDIKTRFSHVWGQDAVLKRVKESIVFMEDPGSIESRGGYVPGGLLLWGPPGTGKTLMAEAVAGETGKPFVFVDPGAFIQMFVGIGPLKVKRLFRKLRQLSIRYGGVIVFFDEADSLGSRGALAGGGIFGPGGVRGMQPSPWAVGDCHGGCYLSDGSVNAVIESHRSVPAPDRSSGPEGRRRIRDRGMVMGGNMGGGGGMGTLQALLTEMSGLTKPRGFMNRVVRRTLALKPKTPPKYRILIMMATNMPNSLDEALLRPGRIDRIYRVGYPSKAGRVRTYEGYFGRVKHDLTPADIEKLATVTPYATGATIKDLVNESLIVSLRNGHERIAWADVLEAKRLKDLGLPEDVEYVERERHAVAIHEACHAVVAYRVRKHLEIDLATIEKGGTYLGMVSSIKPEDRFTSWRSEYEADVMVSLASLAGERQFFGGDSSSGVSGDLESATTIARLMESYWGMGSTIASSAGLGSSMPWPGGQGEGEMLRGDMGKRVEARLHELLQRADDLLKDNRVEVLAVAHALESHKTLSGEDVEAVIEGRQGRGIDGRPYKAPGFAEIFGAYHERLVNAHLARVKIATPLPRPVDWAPDLAADLVGPAANGASLAPTLAD